MRESQPRSVRGWSPRLEEPQCRQIDSRSSAAPVETGNRPSASGPNSDLRSVRFLATFSAAERPLTIGAVASHPVWSIIADFLLRKALIRSVNMRCDAQQNVAQPLARQIGLYAYPISNRQRDLLLALEEDHFHDLPQHLSADDKRAVAAYLEQLPAPGNTVTPESRVGTKAGERVDSHQVCWVMLCPVALQGAS